MERMNKKTIGGIALAAILITATFSLPTASADLTALDKIGTIINLLIEIKNLLLDPNFGLEEIKREVNIIEEEVLDPEHGLEEIKREVNIIEEEVLDPEHGLEEIKSEVNIIEEEVLDPEHGLEEIKDEVRNIEENTFVPFRSSLASETTCVVKNDDSTPTSNTLLLEIESDNDREFIVTSIVIATAGVDDGDDNVSIDNLKVDGTHLAGYARAFASDGFDNRSEILGFQEEHDGSEPIWPQQLAVQGGGTDIELDISCHEDDQSQNIRIPAGGIMVAGWKHKLDTINVTLTNAP